MTQKGKTNNPNGRPKGTPNRITGLLRDSINQFIESKFSEVEAIWDKQEPVEKLKFYKDLLPYVLPKMQSLSISNEFDKMSDEQLERIIDELKRNEQTTKN